MLVEVTSGEGGGLGFGLCDFFSAIEISVWGGTRDLGDARLVILKSSRMWANTDVACLQVIAENQVVAKDMGGAPIVVYNRAT